MAMPVMAAEREIALAEDVRVRPIKGFYILEPLPSRGNAYRRMNPSIVVLAGVVLSRRNYR